MWHWYKEYRTLTYLICTCLWITNKLKFFFFFDYCSSPCTHTHTHTVFLIHSYEWETQSTSFHPVRDLLNKVYILPRTKPHNYITVRHYASCVTRLFCFERPRRLRLHVCIRRVFVDDVVSLTTGRVSSSVCSRHVVGQLTIYTR